DAKPLTSVWTVLIGPVLITCTLPRKKKTLSSNTHQTEHVQSDATQYILSGDKRGNWKKGRIREVRIKQRFYTMQRINLLHSEYNKHALLHIQADFTVVGL
ncbi:unnamed protein product, partial [Staurois parvus]